MTTEKPETVAVGSDGLLALRLPKTQQELYAAMKAGAICHHMSYRGSFNPTAYYFRSDTMKRCTAAAEALLKRGLIEKYDQDWRGHKLRALANGSHEPRGEQAPR